MSIRIKKILSILTLIILSIVLVSCGGNKDDDKPSGSNIPTKAVIKSSDLTGNYVKWEGRYQYIERGIFDVDQMALYMTATGFTIDFYGTELSVRFIHVNKTDYSGGSDIYYNFAIDDEIIPVASNDREFYLPDAEVDKTVTIVSGLTEGRHTIKCLKRNEPADAYTSIVSFETDGGFYERDAEEDDSHTKFLCINASNGSGYGVLYYNPTASLVDRTRKNSSSLHAFMYLSGRMFDADVHFVAEAGWSLCTKTNRRIDKAFDYTGITPTNNNTGAETTALWDHTKYVPDVVLFHIGGNDTTQSNFNETYYKECAYDLVMKIHNLYPNAKMLWVHSSTKCGTLAMDSFREHDILNEGWIDECAIPAIGSDGWGASDHASLKTQIQAAENIASKLESLYGMRRSTRNITFEDYYDYLIK